MKTTKIHVKKENGFTVLEVDGAARKKIYLSLQCVGAIISSILNGEGAHDLKEIGGKDNFRLYLKACALVKPQYASEVYEDIKKGELTENHLKLLEMRK